MIEAIIMVAVGFGILYWAFRVSHKDTESSEAPGNRKGDDKT